jgi:hypothetical protein
VNFSITLTFKPIIIMSLKLPLLWSSLILFMLFGVVCFPVQAASDQYREVTQQEIRHPEPSAAGTIETMENATSIMPIARPQYVLEPMISVPRQRSGNTFGALSLSFGIIGFVFAFIPFITILSPLLAVAAIVLGALGIGRDYSAGLSIGGLVLGILTMLLWLILILLVAALL